MHKLDRASVPAPMCLARFRPGANKWDDVLTPDKEQIRACLQQMQGRRCAYCEASLDTFGQHIEHFRRKGIPQSQHLTFTWSNLFWSCDKDECCGRHKDSTPITNSYNPNDLIDPCSDDPDNFFRFLSNGTIQVRSGLTASDQKRATETLRVFNLNPENGRLRSMRQRALEAYTCLNHGVIEDLAVFTEDERNAYIASEIAQTANDPFCTVIRHFFEAAQ